MSDWPEERRSADLARRVAELEAENHRLRDLLGLGREDRAVSASPWEPTLFPAEGPPVVSGVTRRSSPQQKVELFRALFRAGTMPTHSAGKMAGLTSQGGDRLSRVDGRIVAGPTGSCWL